MSDITSAMYHSRFGYFARPPGVGFQVGLQIKSGASWKTLGSGLTDANGRCTGLMGDEPRWRRAPTDFCSMQATTFGTMKTETFYSEISIVFEVLHPETHYHVPLLLNPFGYSTYRGS